MAATADALPAGWATAALGEVCTIVSGATPKTSVGDFWDGDVRWATPKDLSDLDQKFIRETPRKLTPAGLRSCAAQLLPAGSVLLSSRAPIGLVAINTVPMATNQGFKSLVPNSAGVDSSFLYWWLKAHRSDLEAMGRGATFKEISKAITARIRIPLPPIEEQRRIAAVLDQADELRAKRRAALALLDTLTESIFLDMFGDPVTNPMGWPLVTIGDIVDRFEAGKSVDTSDGDHAAARHWVIKVSAVTSGRFLPNESKPIPLSYVPPDGHFVRQGDLLFSRANTESLVGASALVLEEPSGMVLSDKIWRFVWRTPVRADPTYVWQMLQAKRVRDAIGSLATGTSGSMKNVSQAKFMTLAMPLPPLPLQLEFASAAALAHVQHDLSTRSAGDLDSLFASLQHRAFRGEL